MRRMAGGLCSSTVILVTSKSSKYERYDISLAHLHPKCQGKALDIGINLFAFGQTRVLLSLTTMFSDSIKLVLLIRRMH